MTKTTKWVMMIKKTKTPKTSNRMQMKMSRETIRTRSMKTRITKTMGKRRTKTSKMATMRNLAERIKTMQGMTRTLTTNSSLESKTLDKR